MIFHGPKMWTKKNILGEGAHCIFSEVYIYYIILPLNSNKFTIFVQIIRICLQNQGPL